MVVGQQPSLSARQDRGGTRALSACACCGRPRTGQHACAGDCQYPCRQEGDGIDRGWLLPPSTRKLTQQSGPAGKAGPIPGHGRQGRRGLPGADPCSGAGDDDVWRQQPRDPADRGQSRHRVVDRATQGGGAPVVRTAAQRLQNRAVRAAGKCVGRESQRPARLHRQFVQLHSQARLVRPRQQRTRRRRRGKGACLWHHPACAAIFIGGGDQRKCGAVAGRAKRQGRAVRRLDRGAATAGGIRPEHPAYNPGRQGRRRRSPATGQPARRRCRYSRSQRRRPAAGAARPVRHPPARPGRPDRTAAVPAPPRRGPAAAFPRHDRCLWRYEPWHRLRGDPRRLGLGADRARRGRPLR